MITTANIRDFLKTFELAEHYYIGKLDNKLDKSFGVYTLRENGTQPKAIGLESIYAITNVSVLIHWNNNANDTEIVSRQLYEELRTIKNIEINNHKIYMLELLTTEPVDVGTDDKGIYERVIEFKIYYERK